MEISQITIEIEIHLRIVWERFTEYKYVVHKSRVWDWSNWPWLGKVTHEPDALTWTNWGKEILTTDDLTQGR